MRKGRPPLMAYGPFLCLLLASCGQSTTPSAEESRQLDNAADLLNSAPAELSNIDASALEEPAGDQPAEAPSD